MLSQRLQGVGHVLEAAGAALEQRGYQLVPLESAHSLVAMKKVRGLGPFFPVNDYIFLVDLDAEGVADAQALEEFHQRVRDYGESKMRVPRLWRYRIPNSVTFGVTSGPLTEGMIAVARKSRHKINSGEKHSIHLLDLSSGRYHSAGLERDPLRYAGTWSSDINPTNRVARMLALVVYEDVDRSTLPRRARKHATRKRGR